MHIHRGSLVHMFIASTARQYSDIIDAHSHTVEVLAFVFGAETAQNVVDEGRFARSRRSRDIETELILAREKVDDGRALSLAAGKRCCGRSTE